MFNITEKHRWIFLASGILIVLSIAALIVSTVRFGPPLLLSVGPTSGSLFVLEFDEAVDEDDVRAVFADHGLKEAIIQRLGVPEEHTWQVRTHKVTPDEVDAILDDLDEQVGTVNRDALTFNTVQPSTGAEATRAAGLAILAAVVFIPAFVWWSSRRVPHAFRYGVCAIAGIACSLLFTCGFYALMTVLAGWEMDALFLTATLVVTGFLAQDVIVVFDRIRENASRHRAEPYEMVVNRSILETLPGLLATRLCAVLVLVAIILLGGATIKPFVATMLVGMVGETCSAIFIAVPLLVVWEKATARRKMARATV